MNLENEYDITSTIAHISGKKQFDWTRLLTELSRSDWFTPWHGWLKRSPTVYPGPQTTNPPQSMSDTESFQLRELQRKSKNRLSLRLKKRLSLMFGPPQSDLSENSEGEINSRVFDVPQVPQENNREKFYSIGVDGLDYTNLEVHRLSANSSGTRTSADQNTTPTPSAASTQTNPETGTKRRTLRPRPQSYADPMTEARRGSFGVSDFAKRSSFGLGEVPLLD